MPTLRRLRGLVSITLSFATMTPPLQPAVSPRIIRPYEGVGIPRPYKAEPQAPPLPARRASSINKPQDKDWDWDPRQSHKSLPPALHRPGAPREETHVGSSGRHLPSELFPPAPLSFIHVFPPRLTGHQCEDERGREGYKGRRLVTQLSSEIFLPWAPCSRRPSVFVHFSMSRGGAGMGVGGNPVELWLWMARTEQRSTEAGRREKRLKMLWMCQDLILGWWSFMTLLQKDI